MRSYSRLTAGPDAIDEEILERLVALNKERAIEEKTGKVRWLRPDYQIPRFGSDARKRALRKKSAGRRKRKTASRRSKARFPSRTICRR